jgi:hypothetical protein
MERTTFAPGNVVLLEKVGVGCGDAVANLGWKLWSSGKPSVAQSAPQQQRLANNLAPVLGFV